MHQDTAFSYTSTFVEAEYAFQKNKKIIPLKMERGYNPDGWLGFICGAKLYYEFSHKYPFEQKMPSLMKEILKQLAKDSEKTIEPIIATTTTTVVSRLICCFLQLHKVFFLYCTSGVKFSLYLQPVLTVSIQTIVIDVAFLFL